jgi:DNA polymerase sigma
MSVRKKARVPIMNFVSHFGFECDIAIGGHNGTDTRSYAATQSARFKSIR